MTTMTTTTNGTKEAFKRAALYQSCKQSSILSNIDFENTSTDALVDLVNHYNSQSIRELPIILSKMVVKGALTFITNKYPKARSYINPENIRVRVEDDEMAHLISTSAKRSTNLVTLVVKNLAVSTLGSSIEQIRRELLETTTATATGNNTTGKITVETDIPEEMNLVEPPTVYSNFGSPAETTKLLDTTNDDVTRKRERDDDDKVEESCKRIRTTPEQIDLISDEDDNNANDRDNVLLMDDDGDDGVGNDDNDEEYVNEEKCKSGDNEIDDNEVEEEDADDDDDEVKSNADDDDDDANNNIEDESMLPPPPPPPAVAPPSTTTTTKPKITDVTVFRPSEMKNNFDFFNLVRSEMPNTTRLMTMSNKYQFDNDD